ncbi:MAG: hypothetical protein ABIM64_05585 [candidate division WOR-3 bacterium]
MVSSTICFISKLKSDEFNIVKYTLKKIKSKEIEDLYKELKEIKSVGDKIASFFLREVVCIWNLESKIDECQQIYLQPIDTWVEKILEKIEIDKGKNGKKKLI